MLGLRAALRAFAVTAASVILTAFVGPIALAEVNLPVPTVNQSAVAARGFFYVGGHYIGEPGKHIMQGQIYVEVLAPKVQQRPYPLVLIHGAAQTATNWMGTPDGREGWAEFFCRARLCCLHDRCPLLTPNGPFYSAICLPDPPNSAGKSFFGSPSREGKTVSA